MYVYPHITIYVHVYVYIHVHVHVFIIYTHQAETIQQREDLLRELEAASARTARDTQRKKHGQLKRAEELEAQVHTLNPGV